jgi:hypothetical protein
VNCGNQDENVNDDGRKPARIVLAILAVSIFWVLANLSV